MAKVPATSNRVVIESVTPEVDGGRFPAKSPLGDLVVVEADVFADGHDHVGAHVRFRKPGGRKWHETRMESIGNDRYKASFQPDRLGVWEFEITGWVDVYATWSSGVVKKAEAGVDFEVDLAIGAALAGGAAERAGGDEAAELADLASQLADAKATASRRLAVARSDKLRTLMAAWPDFGSATTSSRRWQVVVDRDRAVFSTWYELFPRSWSDTPGAHGGFQDVEKKLAYVADMGFDVLYLPPVHPIGDTFRKGPNNTMDAGPEDPGVPWAIGSPEGGHTDIKRELGTVEDFRSLRASAEELGMEIALDIAFQCSPDHPWVEEHPEWFRHRPDGTIQYAENPPKKYQDIYPLDFETIDPDGLWKALKGVFEHWMGEGVRIFRVDNPHTKAFPFWEWCIGDIRAGHPDVIFLAEAFTRPKVMYRLAKLGFNQSYTYFAWRNTKDELTSYMGELAAVAGFFRPNFWPNTPDILTEQLQTGGRPAFISRYVLAATLSPSCGIYGPAYELCVSEPIRPGSEEYLDSEKYQVRQWDLEDPVSIAPVIKQVNQARKTHPALQRIGGVVFHHTDNEKLICYSKRAGADVVLTIVNLDPHHAQSGWVDLDTSAIGVDPSRQFQVFDLLTERRYVWQGSRNFVQLDPRGVPAHVFALQARVGTEEGFDYFN